MATAPTPNNQTEPLFYAVTATLPDAACAAEYLDWLTRGHIQQVIAGGATSARIVTLDPEPAPAGDHKPRLETQYQFPSRQTFDRYVRDFAPALRAEGLERFPPSRGVTFQRRLGRIAAALGT